MKITDEMIEAGCKAHPNLSRKQVEEVLQASILSKGETGRPRLMKISVLYIVLCGISSVMYGVISMFVGIDSQLVIGAGIITFLVIGFIGLTWAWLNPLHKPHR